MLIIEDGTGKADAQSLVTAAELVAYASVRGITIPQTTLEQEQLLVRAMDYLESRESDLSGNRSTTAQALAWPRSGVYINGVLFPSDEVPVQAKRAQLVAAIESNSTDLLAPTGKNIKREKVDVLETEYFNGGSQGDGSYPAIDAQLLPLLSSGSSDLSFEIIRA
jgi:hypothetical protein